MSTSGGTHSIASASVNLGNENCRIKKLNNTSATHKNSTNSSKCISSGYVCSDKATNCPEASDPVQPGQSVLNIKLADGPVVLNIQDSPPTEHVTFFPATDTFANSSLNVLQKNKKDFSEESSDSRLYIYDVIGPGYSKVWAHSSLKQYIEARPWFVSILSMSLLSPNYYRDTLIHIPSNKYLKKGYSPVVRDWHISHKLQELSYMDAGHIVVSFENDTYYETTLNSDNTYVTIEIPFLNNNGLIIASIITSFLIGLLGIVSSLKLFSIAYYYIENYYYLQMHNLRNFALARYNNFHKTRENKSQVSKPDEKILKIYLFGTEFIYKSRVSKKKDKQKKYDRYYW